MTIERPDSLPALGLCAALRCHETRLRRSPGSRRGVMLLMVLLTLVLAAALITPLATRSGVFALETGYEAATLRHRLAVESAVALLPQMLEHDRRLQSGLDRVNEAKFALQVGDVRVEVSLQDDTAKLPLTLLFEALRSDHVRDALEALQAGAHLAPLRVRSGPPNSAGESPTGLRWTGCPYDLFEDPHDAALYGGQDSESAWIRYVTPLGKAVHMRRAHAAVLEALLIDLKPGLGHELAQLRDTQGVPDLDELITGLEFPNRLAQRVRQRLTTQTARYSLLIRTELGSDVRQHYVICGAGSPPEVFVNWEIAP